MADALWDAISDKEGVAGSSLYKGHGIGHLSCFSIIHFTDSWTILREEVSPSEVLVI